MSYQQALEAAGAEVLLFQSFGSYQGDWWAKVNFNNETLWVHGTYGSCSGCDAFQSEFYADEEFCDIHYFETSATCPDCLKRKEIYNTKLAAFGQTYLNNYTYTQDEAENATKENLDWDSEAPEVYNFITLNKI